MPTEENQNVQTGGNPSTGGKSDTDDAVNSVVDNNIDLDLNLDGVDIPVEKKTEDVVVADGDDRLAEEDKKVEELQQEKIEEPKVESVAEEINPEEIPVVENMIQEEKQEETVESLMAAPEEVAVESVVEETIKEPVIAEVKENIELETLDIPEVVQEPEIQEEQKVELEADDDQLEQLEELTPISEEVEGSTVEGQLDLDHLDFGSTEDVSEIKEEVIEEIISDTGDTNTNKDGYVPNEHDFGEVTDALNSVESGGSIDLGSLETNADETKNLNVGVETNKSDTTEIKTEGGLDLDSMIEDLGNTDGLNAEKIIAEPVVATVVEKIKTPEVVVNAEVTQSPQIDLGSTTEVVNTVASMPEQAVVMSEPPHKKSSHTGLKIFLFIIVLFVGGIFMLSKMYPEEFGDVMGAIQGEDTTVIEYSDNADSEVVLEETQNSDVELSGDIEEVEEEIDPNSLAGQLEGETVSGDVSNTMEYGGETTDVDVAVEGEGHNADATEEEFNAFEGLEDVMDPVTSENADLLAELREYQAKGIEYDAWGREIGNTTAMKYGLYISEKAETVINDIETNVKIDNTKVENYFAQFDIYIAKLDKLRVSIDGEVQDDALVSSGTDESTTSTGTVQ